MGHKISEWEAAIRRRSDIEFTEMYLTDGVVRTVIGIVLQPSKQKVSRLLPRRVRWNALGVCTTINGQTAENLLKFNINFK
ncbi:MAG: hypothetical protein IK100_06835 [Muribaculaceae bacterium]|nr:hypothetical protein [Muribaculaceae bacterium]